MSDPEKVAAEVLGPALDSLKAMRAGAESAGVIVCYARCWACQFGDHFNPPKVHTWMDNEDVEASNHGLAVPTTAEEWDALGVSYPCACRCAKPEGTNDR